MRKIYFAIVCAASIQLTCASKSNAQNTTLTLKMPSNAIVVDGNGKEWGDTLSFYNPEKKIRYTIANDKDKLYLIVKTKDALQESNILGAGLTFNVDTKGRKRSSFLTTFPSNGGVNPIEVVKMGDEPLAQKTSFAGLTRFKKIGVSGFREVNEDYIATTNSYGIQVALGYDEQGYLVYEEAIPLDLFHAGDLAKNEWSFNIKLNGLEKVGPATGGFGGDASDADAGGGGKGGKGGGKGPKSGSLTQDTSPKTTRITGEIDFWGKFNLAKVQ